MFLLGEKKIFYKNREKSRKSYRLSVFLTISAAGEYLSPFVLLPGTPGGYIETREIPTLDGRNCYAMQRNGWTDERTMLIYLDSVIGPVAKKSGKTQYLLLDSLSTHMTDKVQAKMKELYII